MTAINPSTDIPSNIDTLEKLAVWVGLALTRCNPSVKILESPDATPERAAQAVLFKADDNSVRMMIRLSIPIVDGYAENTAKAFHSSPSAITITKFLEGALD